MPEECAAIRIHLIEKGACDKMRPKWRLIFSDSRAYNH